MSRSFECNQCGERTEKYDDCYCTSCLVRVKKDAEARVKRRREENLAAIILLEKLGFAYQAAFLKKHLPTE